MRIARYTSTERTRGSLNLDWSQEEHDAICQQYSLDKVNARFTVRFSPLGMLLVRPDRGGYKVSQESRDSARWRLQIIEPFIDPELDKVEAFGRTETLHELRGDAVYVLMPTVSLATRSSGSGTRLSWTQSGFSTNRSRSAV
jgi:hypothetical protein